MRILLTANASYAPPKGGSTRSNLVWLAHLVHAGHACCVVCPPDGDGPDRTSFNEDGIEIRSVRDLSRRTQILKQHIAEYRPDWVLVSSEDVTHVLLRAAHAAAPDRLIYLAHTPQWYPFGPASWHSDPQATDLIRQARAVVAIAHTTADYIREYAGIHAHVIHPPMYGAPPWPRFGSFGSGFVLMVNPCVVKGISIFLELARRFPAVEFAGLAGWGTTSKDREAMNALPNVRVLGTVASIDEALSQARLLLMPSLWFEGFGLIAMEAMLRGLPVISSNAGGLVEAKAGTGFVIPVRPIEKFQTGFDETHMPRPVEVPQEIGPWEEALRLLLTDQSVYWSEADRSRDAATKFVSGLKAADFEALLVDLAWKPMRILLAHNSLYFPSHGGGDKSNRLLMEALAAEGHEVRVVARVQSFGPADGNKLLDDLAERSVEAGADAEGVVRFSLANVDVRTVAFQSNLRQVFSRQIEEFDPDIIVTSTDDPGQLLFDLALRAPRARVVYLIRATIAAPFGPDSSAPNAAKADLLKQADGVVGVSEYVAAYARKFGGLDAIHAPISLLDEGAEPPHSGRFDAPYVSMVNPCAVKGIGIFLELADRMPHVMFAAVPTWGTTPEDYNALTGRPNVTVMPPVDDIDELLKITRVMLVPSVWAEARSRIVVEAMSRGVPVISSNAGGIPEAHLGIDYMFPVNVIERYQPSVDMNMVPVAEVPPQDVAPWQTALERLVSDRVHWEDLSRQSREAALAYSRDLSVLPFETFLKGLLSKPKKAKEKPRLSEDKRKLLALRLKQKAAAARQGDPVVAGAEELQAGDTALICFPWAGGGTLQYRRWRDALRGIAVPVAIRLPGRESRMAEPPFESMHELIASLGPALERHLQDRRFAFFGHSMGAGIAFEMTRWLRQRNAPLPAALIVSGARAPQFRLNALGGPDPTEEELLAQLRGLEGIPLEVSSKPELLRLAMRSLRADTMLYRRYIYSPGEPLPIPIFAYGGDADPNVHPEHLDAWRDQTRSTFIQRQFPGGHFYLLSPETRITEAIRADLTQA